ncbi:MAG: ABC transporter substrate-binding protein [Candidatus Sumerlaeaceae bacterium]
MFTRAFHPSVIMATAALLLGCTGCDKSRNPTGRSASGVTLHVNVDGSGKAFQLTQELSLDYEQRTGVRIELIRGPSDTTERLSQYLQFLGAKSPDIDLYQVDVIWPAILANHLLDLKDAFTTETEAFFPSQIKNDTVDGRLIAIPWYGDAGLLYFRSDLLAKYNLSQPPQTWDELTTMAELIQKGERATGKGDFWGYVWQGKAYEGLTCNALEWQASSGGGRIVEEGRRINVNNPGARRAFERAAGWVGTISPRGVTTYGEEEARQMFQSGNAAFLRNWPYVYSLASDNKSPVKGKFGATVLPTGGTGHAATLGGWHLAVSKYSPHPREATEFVRFLASIPVQRRRALEASMLPARVALYDDPEIASTVPLLPTMKQVFLEAVARPSAAAGEDYNEVSTYYFQAVHQILTGEKTAERALADLDEALHEVLR